MISEKKDFNKNNYLLKCLKLILLHLLNIQVHILYILVHVIQCFLCTIHIHQQLNEVQFFNVDS